MGISTISRPDHPTAQTKELQCTKVVLPQVLARGFCGIHANRDLHITRIFFAGLNITEVAHDIQQQMSPYITGELSMINSFDTWHGSVLQCIRL